MRMNTLRRHWKTYNVNGTILRRDVEAYLKCCKQYVGEDYQRRHAEGKDATLAGLCYYAKEVKGYPLWSTMACVKGSVASEWQYLRATGYVPSGRTGARIKMVKALIKELEEMLDEDRRKR